MASLKKQQKKLLTKEITSRVMDYLLGLNEENQPVMQKLAKKFSRKIVDEYYDTLKVQHKSLLQSTTQETGEVVTVMQEEATNLMAS